MILVAIAIAGVAAFLIGVVMLVMYYRYNQVEAGYEDEPVIYGSLVQCPNCGYMNPPDAAACLNCRQPLHLPPSYQPLPPAPYVAPQPDYGYAPRPVPPAAPAAPVYAPTPDINVTAPARAMPAATQRPPTPIPASPPAASAAATLAASTPDGLPTAWLEGVAGPVQGTRFTLAQPDTLVGRSTACDVQVYDPKVSRRHFLIRYANGGFFLQDQQSSRGTRINGAKVMAQRLQDGDRIDFGDTSLVFHMTG